MRQGHINVFSIGVLLLILSACTSEQNQQQSRDGEAEVINVTLELVWATGRDELITPECVTYNPDQNVFYVSNLNRDNEMDDDGYISVVNADGTIQEVKWVEGLGSPLGNDFHDEFLYVTDDNEIVKIDIEDGSVSGRIVVEGATDMNGIDIAEDGTIYTADSDGNQIYRVSPDGDVALLYEGEELNTPNGVYVRGNELLIASSGGNSLLSLNLSTNELTTLVDGGLGRADGIIPLEGGHFLISSWSGQVYFVSSDLQVQTLLDTSNEEINAADIGYIPEEKLLVVPTFYDNRLVAYKINY